MNVATRRAAVKHGDRFSRLQAKALMWSGGRWQWACLCECGKYKLVRPSNLISGMIKSCGCLLRDVASAAMTKMHFKHGGARTKEYRAWIEMKRRVTDPNRATFKRYIQRGITMCERWQSFEAFLADMGPRPSPLHSVERLNNDGNYEPENCAWATIEQQNRNKSNVTIVELGGERLSVPQIARKVGCLPESLLWRIRAGMTPAEAVNHALLRKGGSRC